MNKCISSLQNFFGIFLNKHCVARQSFIESNTNEIFTNENDYLIEMLLLLEFF